MYGFGQALKKKKKPLSVTFQMRKRNTLYTCTIINMLE